LTEEVHYNDSSNDGDSKIKVIYVDIKSLKFINPLLQEILPSANLNKYTPYFQKNFSPELMNKVETELKKTLKLLIFASCNMLLHKVCPCRENIQTETLEMYTKSLSLFTEFLEIFRQKQLQNAYFKLLELHNHIKNIPDTPRFYQKLEEMMDEIMAAINTNEHKEIFCFDVTDLFHQQTKKEDKKYEEEYKKNRRENLNDHKENNNEDNFGALFKILLGFCALCTASWKISKIYFLPYLMIVSQFIEKKVKKGVKKYKFWQKAKKVENKIENKVKDLKKHGIKKLKKSWKDFKSVDIFTHLFWLKWKICDTIATLFNNCLYKRALKRSKMRIPAITYKTPLKIILILLIIFYFCFSGNQEQHHINMPSPTRSYEEDYKTYSSQHAEDLIAQIRDLDNREAQHYKDIKFIKAELDWLIHKVEENKRRGEVLVNSDLQDMTESINKALQKYPNFR